MERILRALEPPANKYGVKAPPVFPEDSPEDLPSVLIILAPMHQPGSRCRENEIMFAKLGMLDFIESAFARVSQCEFQVCNDSGEMLHAVIKFCETLCQNERPFLVFHGHGNPEGCLLWLKNYWEPEGALAKIDSIFAKHRPQGVNKWPLRCIFGHCYSHLLDRSKARPGEIIRYSANVEFAYVTDEKGPLNTTKFKRKSPPLSE